MLQIWKDVKGYEGYYMVSNMGCVKSLDRIVSNGSKRKGRNLKKDVSVRGYEVVTLSIASNTKIRNVHQLVAETFMGHIPDGTNRIVVDHIDANKTNNILSNLQLLTNRQNCSKDKKGCSSIYTGVRLKDGAYESSIRTNGKKVYLGRFAIEEDANFSYQEKLKELNESI